MRVKFNFKFEGTEDELRESPGLAALMEGLSTWATRAPDATFDPDADDAAAEMADAEAATPPAATGPGTIPGVPVDGQDAVRAQLDENRASELFERFLAETATWPSAKVVGIKPRRSPVGSPLDYSRYLRIRKEGSQLGAFVYVNPASGLVEPRLHYATDAELHAVAPRAERHDKSHPAYRVNIYIVDEETLDQALSLARLAYDRT